MNTSAYCQCNGVRSVFNPLQSGASLEELIPGLPEPGVCYKFISSGGFSSISFVLFVAAKTKIRSLTASTLRVGKKELGLLNMLHMQGDLDHCNFIIGSIMSQDSKKGQSYGYYEAMKQVCENNGWDYGVINNHSKILLFDTDAGKFVLETSSNLNENPKIEQFSFEQNETLYELYGKYFDDLLEKTKASRGD